MRFCEETTSLLMMYVRRVSARLEDSGQYKVRAHNEAGEAVSLASLNVFEPPTSITESCELSQNIIENKVKYNTSCYRKV